MNKEQANEQVWQFKSIEFLVSADELVTVDPFKPADIIVTKTKKGIKISGRYGVDIFPNHQFTLLVDGKLKEYTRVEELPETFDNVINYAPDPTHDITFTYTFKKNGKEFKYIHWVHHDMAIWEKFLVELMRRETDGGRKNASSNKSR